MYLVRLHLGIRTGNTGMGTFLGCYGFFRVHKVLTGKATMVVEDPLDVAQVREGAPVRADACFKQRGNTRKTLNI